MDAVVAPNRPADGQPSVSPTASQNSPALESDFETFLVLLTTQLQNQDPLNPLESTDFAVQLATFSGVEQQVRTNDLLADMASGGANSGFAQLADWVGMEARVVAPAQFAGAPIDLSLPAIPDSVDEVRLIVTNSAGAVVGTEAVPPTADAITWAGTDSTGTPFPPGTYRFEIEASRDGDVVSRADAAHFAIVEEARMSGGEVEIVTATGARVSASEVTALRLAPEDR